MGRKIKSKLILLGKNIQWLADELNISKAGLYAKLSGKTRFTLDEVRTIVYVLELSKDEIVDIFFKN